METLLTTLKTYLVDHRGRSASKLQITITRAFDPSRFYKVLIYLGPSHDNMVCRVVSAAEGRNRPRVRRHENHLLVHGYCPVRELWRTRYTRTSVSCELGTSFADWSDRMPITSLMWHGCLLPTNCSSLRDSKRGEPSTLNKAPQRVTARHEKVRGHRAPMDALFRQRTSPLSLASLREENRRNMLLTLLPTWQCTLQI